MSPPHCSNLIHMSRRCMASGLARKFIKDIPPETWKNASWIMDNNLSPRYGITSPNISKSVNSMFETARDCSQLDSSIIYCRVIVILVFRVLSFHLAGCPLVV